MPPEWRGTSPRAGGKYQITSEAVLMLHDLDDHQRARLTSWLIEQRRLGDPCPQVGPEQVHLIKQERNLSVRKRANNLLRYVLAETPRIGTDFQFENHSFSIEDTDAGPQADRFWEMLAWSESMVMEELKHLMEYLKSARLLKRTPVTIGFLSYRLTVRGYGYLDEIDRPVPSSAQSFVAMWFDESMDPEWSKGIEPAIKDAGYKPIRIDQRHHLDKIDDQIITEIRRSGFLVADFTHGSGGKRGGVYYEAGFAHWLNLPVIFTCRDDAVEQLHFDTRQYPHILWKSPEELRKLLSRRISAVLGDGPHGTTASTGR